MLKNLFKQDKNSSASQPRQPDSAEPDAVETAFHYHSETKHHFHRYARSAGYMDWANQPNPFRRFEGAEILPLPFIKKDESPRYARIYDGAGVAARAVSRESIAQLFELSLGISAWKEFQGSRWALRVNPSSGNLHPTEGYLVFGSLSQDSSIADFPDAPMVCHYASNKHYLEVRATFSQQTWRALMAAFPAGSFLAGLSSIHWREAWKYGERAFRYCQHDVGHALAAMRFSAAALGWQLIALEDLADAEIAAILGLDRTDDFIDAESEHPDLLAVVIPDPARRPTPLSLPANAIQEIAAGSWHGTANLLSREHQDWPIIDAMTRACEKPHTHRSNIIFHSQAAAIDADADKVYSDENLSASKIIMQRRSAVRFDKKTEISARSFYQMLARTMPGANAPWDSIYWPACVHLCLFVHRVRELLPGLYLLARDVNKLGDIKSALKPEFIKEEYLWQKPPACPSDLPLYFLVEGDCQELARQVSCTQDIAGDGVFSLGMVAEFEATIREFGAWRYRQLFWETGMIGQVLYLEAEAIGIRATGIGCFYDDPVHEVFGFVGRKYQSLYHFTMGMPIEDARLTTLPPYSNELKRRE